MNDEMEACTVALESHGYVVHSAEDAVGGILSIQYSTGTASRDDAIEAREEAQRIVDTVCGGDGPEVRDAEGGREGQPAFLARW